MGPTKILQVFLALAYLLCSVYGGKKSAKVLIDEIGDHKDFKKLLRTKNNVLVCFMDQPQSAGELVKLLRELSEKVKGTGTVAMVDCGANSEAKKLCKKLKVSPSSVSSKKYLLKHYKDGDFHKDYDRPEKLASMVTFMRDPTGDAPWEEDEASADVLHIGDPRQFAKLLKQEKGKVLVMFYAPWCGFCKRMKPDYQMAASEIRGSAVMAALDVTRPENNIISKKYNITGFPTLLYFEEGVMKYPYPGDNNRQALVSFLKNPQPEVEKKPAEKQWKDEPDSQVVHLTDATFDEFMASNPSVLVMFYAPWCGHCKAMKPKFDSAASKLTEGKLAAVDCTSETKLGARFGVKGYPTVKYFKDGSEAFDAGHAREEAAILEFMKDPKEPPPPPPPEKPWSEEENEVVHLNEESFKPFLKKKKHVLVMFYAPWCGHCKKAKPEITEAAAEFKDDPKVEFAAVDCTVDQSVCSALEVSGYPTFKYFKYFNKEQKPYDGGRTKDDFVAFMKDPENPSSGQPPPVLSPEQEWKEHEGAEHVKHLGSADFDSFVKSKDHVLVAFYAPWCGHCKAMKGDYAGAALKLSTDSKISASLAAVDATIERDLGSRFEVKGYPTIKYFYKGRFYQEFQGGRRKMDFVEFIKKKAAAAQKDEL